MKIVKEEKGLYKFLKTVSTSKNRQNKNILSEITDIYISTHLTVAVSSIKEAKRE